VILKTPKDKGPSLGLKFPTCGERGENPTLKSHKWKIVFYLKPKRELGNFSLVKEMYMCTFME
jgi:hypothetical protein